QEGLFHARGVPEGHCKKRRGELLTLQGSLQDRVRQGPLAVPAGGRHGRGCRGQGCQGDHGLRLRDSSLTQQEMITVAEESIDSGHGFEPAKRPISLYLSYGLIPLDKTRGPTSHEVVS